MIKVKYNNRNEEFDQLSEKVLRERFSIPPRKKLYRQNKKGRLAILQAKEIATLKDGEEITALSDFRLG